MLNKKIKRLNSPYTFPQVVLNIVTLAFLFMVLYPLFLTIVKSFKTFDQEYANPYGLTLPICWDNYSFAWQVVRPYIFNTFSVVIPITFLVLMVSSFAAFAFVRLRFPFKETIFMAILSLMMVPGLLTLLTQYEMINAFNLINTRLGVILPAVSGTLPWGIFLLRTFFSGVSKDLFDAAEISGANKFVCYFKIMVPLSVPIIATLGLNTFLGEWNNLVWPRLVLLDEDLYTITIGLMPFTTQYYSIYHSYGPPLAGCVICSIPLIVLFAFTSRQFISGLTSGAFKM